MAPSAHTGKLEGSFPSLLKSGEYSDLEVHCGEDVYKVHKAILCPQSEFFRLAVKAENGFQEAVSGIITLHEADPDVVKTMIVYLYQGNYPTTTKLLGKATLVHIVHHVMVYGAAEMYQILELKNTVLKYIKSKTRFGLGADEIAGDNLHRFIQAVYSVTPARADKLRAYVLDKVAKDFDAVRAGKGLPKTLQEIPEFAEDLLITLNDERKADKDLVAELVPRLRVDCAAYDKTSGPKLQDILKMGKIRCNACDQEQEGLIWSVPETKGKDDSSDWEF